MKFEELTWLAQNYAIDAVRQRRENNSRLFLLLTHLACFVSFFFFSTRKVVLRPIIIKRIMASILCRRDFRANA